MDHETFTARYVQTVRQIVDDYNALSQRERRGLTPSGRKSKSARLQMIRNQYGMLAMMADVRYTLLNLTVEEARDLARAGHAKVRSDRQRQLAYIKPASVTTFPTALALLRQMGY